MYQHLLVPIDDSPLGIELIGQAVEYARSTRARITFLYVRADYMSSMEGEGALFYSMAPDLLRDLALGNIRSVLSKAQAAARARCVTCNTLSMVSDRPAEAILQAASEQACDMIFMGSRGKRGLAAWAMGSVTLRVLADARVPVLVASIARNAAIPEMVSAIGVIQDEHRSLSVVIHSMQHYVKDCLSRAAAPNFRLLRAMIHYVHAFPEMLHHPKENDHLFRLLRQRTAEFNDLLDVQMEQHEKDPALVAMMETHLARWENGDDSSAEQFAESVNRFAEATWVHMGMEESIILPAAVTHLERSDWQEIAEAFSKNGDPRFTDESAQDIQALFKRIVNLAPSESS